MMKAMQVMKKKCVCPHSLLQYFWKLIDYVKFFSWVQIYTFLVYKIIHSWLQYCQELKSFRMPDLPIFLRPRMFFNNLSLNSCLPQLSSEFLYRTFIIHFKRTPCVFNANLKIYTIISKKKIDKAHFKIIAKLMFIQCGCVERLLLFCFILFCFLNHR